jgi:hypothetical protein
LALSQIINEEDAVLIPKNQGKNISSGFLHLEFFFFVVGGWEAGMSRYAATPLIVAFSPDHSNITRFRLYSTIATGNHLDRGEKIPKFAQTNGTVEVFDPRSGISGPTTQRAFACPNLHE